MFMQVDLPEPLGPHYGDELALGNVERNAAQRFDPPCPLAKDLGQTDELHDKGRRHLAAHGGVGNHQVTRL